MVFHQGTLAAFERVPVDSDGSARIDLDGLDRESEVVLAISGLTPVTTEEAHYQYRIELR